MKKWKKTHRERVKYRERKLINVRLESFPKELYMKLKNIALNKGISINNLVRQILREAIKEFNRDNTI